MSRLHIVQGGVENGDLAWIRNAGQGGTPSPAWVVPKTASAGDIAVVYVGGHGLVATATIATTPAVRVDWANRYGSPLADVVRIEPPISIGTIQRRIPSLAWARYPRSITTPASEAAAQLSMLIADRRQNGVQLTDEEDLTVAGLAELRAVALQGAKETVPVREGEAPYRLRSIAIRLYVLARARGRCEGCDAEAPFRSASGAPYLEPHHTTRLADDGPDDPANVIGLCPNCHRRAHYSADAIAFSGKLQTRLAELEPEETA